MATLSQVLETAARYLKMPTSSCRALCWIWQLSVCCQARLRARPSFRSVLEPRWARCSSGCSRRFWTLGGSRRGCTAERTSCHQAEGHVRCWECLAKPLGAGGSSKTQSPGEHSPPSTTTPSPGSDPTHLNPSPLLHIPGTAPQGPPISGHHRASCWAAPDRPGRAQQAQARPPWLLSASLPGSSSGPAPAPSTPRHLPWTTKEGPLAHLQVFTKGRDSVTLSTPSRH